MKAIADRVDAQIQKIRVQNAISKAERRVIEAAERWRMHMDKSDNVALAHAVDALREVREK